MQQSKYRIVGLVGQGQFGRVFCATNRQTGQIVALKELSHQRAPTQDFLRELWFIISLRHPNVVTCQALEHTATGRYLVMDYCEGGTLRSLLQQERPLRLGEGLQLVYGLLQGLEYVHKRGVIHCDIKPENILLSLHPRGWVPRLSDFGIARRLPEIGRTRLQQKVSPDATIGSPGYMAPERFYGLYSPRSDIYAIGILLFELLMGYRPFSGHPEQLRWAHMNQRLHLPEIMPQCLQNIVQKSLEKLPGRRFATAANMAEAISTVLKNPEIKAIGGQIVPWKRQEEDADIPAPSTYYQIRPQESVIAEIGNPEDKADKLPLLTGCGDRIYGSRGKTVITYHFQGTEAQSFSSQVRELSESVLHLFPTTAGCWLVTRQHLYWQSVTGSFPEKPAITFDLSPLPTPSSTGVNDVATALPPKLPPLKAAFQEENQWLAIASWGKLDFYHLSVISGTEFDSGVGVPVRSFVIPRKTIPDLIMLDQRHLLTIWRDAKHKPPQTIFRVYTRRGTVFGSLRLPILFKKILPTLEPYTLLAIPVGSKPSLLKINLWPLNVMRIPLETVPVCACVTASGMILGDGAGTLLLFNGEGQIIAQGQGPANPKAITGWGNDQIAIVSESLPFNPFPLLTLKMVAGSQPTPLPV